MAPGPLHPEVIAVVLGTVAILYHVVRLLSRHPRRPGTAQTTGLRRVFWICFSLNIVGNCVWDLWIPHNEAQGMIHLGTAAVIAIATVVLMLISQRQLRQRS